MRVFLGQVRQHFPGLVFLTQLIVDITDFEQRVGDLLTFRVLADQRFELLYRVIEVTRYIVGLPQPVLGIVGKFAGRVFGEELLK